MDPVFLLLVFCLGIGVAFLSSFMSGGLGMLSLTALLSLGLPAHTALGTFRIAAFGFSVGGLYQYIKAGKIIWDLVIPLSVAGTLGAVIGAHIVIALPEDVVRHVIGFVILLFIPLSIWKPKLGVENRTITSVSKRYGYLSAFFGSIWGASVTIGTGIIMLYSQMYFFGRTILEVKGTNRIPNLVKLVFVTAIFGLNGLIDWQIGLVFGGGMFVGSWVGTIYAIRAGDEWLRKILLVTIGLLAVKLVLGW